MSKKLKAEDLPYRPCVGIMVLNRDGLVWAGRRIPVGNSEYDGSPQLWQMQQGGIDKDEDPLKAAYRELYEETGIRGEKPLLFATYDLPGLEDGPGSPSFFLSVFKVKADASAVAVASDDSASVGWYTAEEIAGMPAPDSVRECIARLEAERLERTA